MDSIYRRILKAAGEDGVLPADFSLGGPPASNRIRFADGAMDGILLYHSMGQGAEELLEHLKEITKEASEGGSFETLLEKLEGLFDEQDGMLSCIDGLQDWIIANRQELSAERVFRFAERVLTESGEKGAVKYALSVLELFAGTRGSWREHVRTLALSEEFTLFCVFIARAWEDAGKELFGMAKKVRGWGRIHAVEALVPENQEMRDWLFFEGWRNEVLPSYSAVPCAVKGGLSERLRKELLSDGEFEAAGGLLQALFDEGPLPGISSEKLEDPQGLLLSFLGHGRRRALLYSDYETIEAVRDKADEMGWTEARQEAEKLLQSEECRRELGRAMKEGLGGFALAKKLGMKYEEALLASLDRDFSKRNVDLFLIFEAEDRELRSRAMEICERELPESLGTGPADWSFAVNEPRYNMLGYCVQFLRRWPGEGETLVRTALLSPVINNRNMALNVLEDWKGAGWQETEGIKAALQKLKETEENEHVRERLKTM